MGSDYISNIICNKQNWSDDCWDDFLFNNFVWVCDDFLYYGWKKDNEKKGIWYIPNDTKHIQYNHMDNNNNYFIGYSILINGWLRFNKETNVNIPVDTISIDGKKWRSTLWSHKIKPKK